MIVKSGSQYKVKTEDGSRTLGTHSSHEDAARQLRAIEASKARRHGTEHSKKLSY